MKTFLPPHSCRSTLRHVLCALLLLGCVLCPPPAAYASGFPELEKGFLHPPPDARPWVYWFWLNGNITSNGITADLEAMQRVGIGGVLIMEVDQGTPPGAAAFGSPRWRGLFQHVCAEAHRLGLQVNMNNDAGWCGSGGPWITPASAMQKVVWTQTEVKGPRHFAAPLPQPKGFRGFYQDIAVLAFPTPAPGARLDHLDGKAAFVPEHLPITGTFQTVPPAQTVPRSSILNLTTSLSTNGQFTWEVPAGSWTILRLGHTATGTDNHPAPEPGRGLESDKLSKAATDLMFQNLMGKLIADSKPLAGNTLVSTHIDSWETGSQNWTPHFAREFQKRRGYSLLDFLPVLTGRVVDSEEVSERFLWDLRQTVSDLLVANYAGEFERLARHHGLRLSIEAYDGTPCNDLAYAGKADEPMAEFWSWGYNTAYSCLEMSSAAHTYGKRVLGAEAFTATDGEKWQLYPGRIKTLGDWAFCEGINRFVFHRYAMQPWDNLPPGMSMGPWGLHYERTETWWEQSSAWHEYLARCQFLLRRGLFVADICFLEPEGSPRRFTPTMPWRAGNTPDRPRYDFDGCSPEVVLHRMKVRHGRLVLPDGMSYRLLVLPQVETMSPQLLRKIHQLVQAGATVIGPPPRKAPGLSGYPGCDQEVRALAASTWDGQAHHHVLWDSAFATPAPDRHSEEVFKNVSWVWYPEGSPAISAPPGKRYFRRALLLEQPLASARLNLTVDNSFDVWVNGRHAGEGDNFKQVYSFDVAQLLKPGTNLIAVAAVNATEQPNPAGMIGMLQLKFKNGTTGDIKTDSGWEAATNAPADWTTDAASDSGWTHALELGAFGMQPWGELTSTAEPPYVYPDFQAVTSVLKKLGLPPDFEGPSDLRFIHRREGQVDIYFVASSQTNWLQANCTFRVSGKRAEIWDPATGQRSSVLVSQEQDGRTVLPMCFEPAGSRFVLFRHEGRRNQSGQTFVSVARDGKTVFPVPGGALTELPSVELAAADSAGARALVWEPGRYSLQTRAGQGEAFDVPSVPPPFELTGPWQVEFQPGRGAPPKLTFETLSDWSQNPEPGVRYFSGSATYTKTFSLPLELSKPGERLFLDLGEVAVSAQVKLNGKDLGILWKAPYRVEVTSALRPGENRLEIQVVNLWINRMIGDEQLPEDSERNSNGTLKRWPDWLAQGLPSPTGRYSFTVWRLWKKDSPLQRSGLIGPVRVLPTLSIQLKNDSD